jgi:hypothetical protein
MKNKLLSLIVGLIVNAAFSVSAHTQTDFSKIIQKCVDLPELQAYYSAANGFPPQQLYILYHGLEFPSDMTVTKFGKPVLLISKQGLQEYSPDVWMIFRELNLVGNKCNVDFRMYYKYTTEQETLIVVNLELEKNGSVWTVKKIKTEGGKI